ncbi:hypothetical protein J5N97_029306 [Dioscorea zingiberensis]|uniref:Uncharacterized protein n=1 Tax=Dioscorea zingiberensis TaxID=325984 RepID=A0A9D5C0P7_9LILI|nr:hypothetical protein J5N97_029306 [Dioscorea zingiberensis]
MAMHIEVELEWISHVDEEPYVMDQNDCCGWRCGCVAPNGMHNLCYVNLVLRFLKYVLHTVGLISVVRLKKLGNLMYSYIAEIDTKLHQFVSGSGAILHLMAAICCGTVGQKVVKACSGKLHPSYQFFYLAFVELLPVVSLNLDEVEPQHRRYDHLICVFRHKLQKELEDAKVFIVQYGTLGGEFLKNMAIIGVYCSSKRKLTIKDDDCSNICATNWGVHEGLHRSCSECEMGGQFIDPQPNTAPFISK